MNELNLNDIFALKKELEDTRIYFLLKTTIDSEAQKYAILNGSNPIYAENEVKE